jgi:hypothetical protein
MPLERAELPPEELDLGALNKVDLLECFIVSIVIVGLRKVGIFNVSEIDGNGWKILSRTRTSHSILCQQREWVRSENYGIQSCREVNLELR